VIKKLQALIAGAQAPYHPQKVLISNPPGEFHTIAPLMINLLLRYRGWEVSYLGANVPDDQMENALERVQPSLVVMTAARLTTAAALLKTSQLLQNHNIPLAFGGTIFSSIPSIAERIPGTYLNTDLGQVVSRIESLLSTPDLEVAKSSLPNPYLDLWKEFKEKLPYIENQALLSIVEGEEADYPNDILEDANSYLFQDILAALALGDIQYLQPNFDWTKGLMQNRSYQPGQFKGYLQSFTDTTAEVMSGQAQPLIKWLRDYTETLG
jgi:hypothetical protein